MLRDIHVETTMFDRDDDVHQTRKDLLFWLEALTQRNQDFLLQRPNTPRLYKSGVKYERPQQMITGEIDEVRILRQALGKNASKSDVQAVLAKIQRVLGGEHFCDVGVILERGGIDCDGLACWRAAELRQAGIQARPFMTHRTNLLGGTTYHALVLWPPMKGVAEVNGIPKETSEDPSLLLGMGGPARAADRAEEIRKNAERCDILRGKQGFKNVAPVELEAALDDVLGLRRIAPKSEIAEINDFFKRVA